MPILSGTLTAIYNAKYNDVLGSTNLTTVAASGLAALTLATPQALLVTVAPADDPVEAFAQVIRVKEAFPNYFIHAVIQWDGSDMYELLTSPFGFDLLRVVFTPTGASVYISGTANASNTWRSEFPENGLVKG